MTVFTVAEVGAGADTGAVTQLAGIRPSVTARAPRLRFTSLHWDITVATSGGIGVNRTVTAKAAKLTWRLAAVETDQSTFVEPGPPRLSFHAGVPAVQGATRSFDGSLFLLSSDGQQTFMYGFRPKVWSVAAGAFIPVRALIWSAAQGKWVNVPWQQAATFLG